ncbi:uncharacterized protein K441DRAFT_621209 [Cenococcum geophilum 1.58]|uniref:Uncharacterized protein n=1 Tax=Cenococcum geophilum 1.58 TaxID=794803 RepID=A0ACC8ERH7_9PEZI|nr:hypothetical protein K441DRAFT_621209 [Cenococcum geophilum 1.58]
MEKKRTTPSFWARTLTVIGPKDHGQDISRRLGKEIVTILITSIIGIFLSTGMFCYLWWGNYSDSIWRKIALNGWLPRTVTLLSAVVRWSVFGQALISTSMLAALAFSQERMWLHQSASLSVMRYVNTGPSSLVWLLVKDPLPRFASAYTAWILVLTIACTTILSQFCSTVLLSDFNDGIIVGRQSNISAASGYNDIIPGRLRWSDYWHMLPRSYPAFAEQSNFMALFGGIDDTGMSLRGILPLVSEESRSLVHSFNGNATVLDSRIACSRPQYEDLILHSYSLQNSSRPNPMSKLSYLTGSVVRPPLLERLVVSDLIGTQFNCSVIPSGISLDLYYTGSALRGLDSDPEELSYYSLPLVGKAYLLFNFTHLNSLTSLTSGNYSDLVSTPNGPWTEIKLFNSALRIQSTLCFDALFTLDTPILASSQTNRTEPSWEFDPEQRRFVTGSIRKQLGAGAHNLTFQDRGILSMETTPLEMRQQAKALVPFNGSLKYLTKTFAAPVANPYFAKFSAFFCPTCNATAAQLDDVVLVHPQQATTFQDILLDTGRPALALQAHLTTLVRMVYYDNLPMFDYSGNQTLDFFVPILLPTTHLGLVGVIMVLLIQQVAVLIIVLRFMSSEHSTLLGNAWQAVSQLCSDEASDILRDATQATDGDVKHQLKAAGKRFHQVVLAKSADGDRIEITRAETGSA